MNIQLLVSVGSGGLREVSWGCVGLFAELPDGRGGNRPASQWGSGLCAWPVWLCHPGSALENN